MFDLLAVRPHLVLPVIHYDTPQGALDSMFTAERAGADGLVLIDNRNPSQRMYDLARAYRRCGGTLPMLVNPLTAAPLTISLELTLTDTEIGTFAGVWRDEGHIHGDKPSLMAKNVYELVKTYRKRVPNYSYLGGVAFKTQSPVPDRVAATYAAAAATCMDLVCTSGPRTGSPPTTGKLAAMHEALERVRAEDPTVPAQGLAIASGITPDNVRAFLPYARAFLVASSIEEPWGYLDPVRTKALVDAVRAG